MIEKTRVVKIKKTPEEVKAIFEKAIREEDESVVFPADYDISIYSDGDRGDIVPKDEWPSISITLEIPEPRKPGRPKGSKKKEAGGIISMDATATGQVA
jgi:hypothetical protein